MRYFVPSATISLSADQSINAGCSSSISSVCMTGTEYCSSSSNALLQRGVAHSPRPCATFWVRDRKRHGVCSSESFHNLLAPPFPLPACPQTSLDMGRLLPMAAVAAEPDGAIMSKTRGCYPRARLASRLDGRSSLAQPTHTRSLSRRLNFHTITGLHLLNPYGQPRIKRSCQRHPRRMRFPLTEVSAGFH
jgi:hypothetical protein